MATDLERLIVSLEARTKSFENALIKANATAQRQLRGIEERFKKTNKNLSLDFGGAKGAVGGFAAAAGANEIRKYADAWTEAGNQIKATSAATGTQARSLRELNDIADKTRSGFSETVDLYAKLLRSTKDVAKGEEEVARATEIVNKAFKAGGAGAEQQAAGILQLSQALGSGVLQGDELRSLRENAPILAQAIADEFGTTIAGLKQLGADGLLTSDRIFKAILKAGPQIERQFGQTTATIADGWTAVDNAIVEAIGRINEVTGASAAAGNRLGELAGIVNNLADTFVGIAQTPAGKFLGFLNQVIEKLDPIQRALKALSTEGLGKGIANAAGVDAKFSKDDIKAATIALDEFFKARKEAADAGFLTKEQAEGFEKLADAINKSKVSATEAEAEVRRLVELDPGTSPQIIEQFDVVIERLKLIKKTAEDAIRAATGVFEGGRQAGFAMQSQNEKTAKFFADRNSDAARSELDKQIDTRAKAIIDAAEKVGVSLDEAAAKIQAKSEIAAETAAKSVGSASDVIKNFESFRAKSYFDVNHERIGYGSDTVTLSDGSIHEVTKGMTTTLEDANRDLERRIGEFQKGIKSQIGADTFNSLNDGQQAALTSIAYNYGSLPDRIVQAIRGGDTAAVYTAIKGLGSDNNGVNRDRRNSEAQMYLSGAPEGIKKGIDSQEDFAKRLEQQKAYIAGLQAQTGIMATLSPLVNDYGQKLSTVQAAQDLLTSAQEEGTAAGRELKDVQQLLYGDLSKLTPEAQKQALAMRELANQTGTAEAAGNRLDESQQRLQQNLQESAALGKDVLGGFIHDLIEGKSATEALGNALSKIGDKLLDIGLNALFDGSKPGSGGGLLGGLFSFLFAAKGGVYAHGRKQPMKTFAKGGVSRSAAIFGEAGPEAAVPLPDGRRIPVDLRGPASAKGGGEVIRVVLQDDSGRMAEIADQRIKTRAGAIVEVAVDRSNRNVVPTMARFQNDRAGSDYRT